MGRTEQGYCCECDYCALSPCSDSGAWGAWGVSSMFLTDHPQTHNYYLFCEAHRLQAEADVQIYLIEHPGVAIDPND